MGQMHWHWFIGPVVAVLWAAVFVVGFYLVAHYKQHRHS